MKHYSDVNGDSGVAAYEIGESYIDVQFKKTGVTYRYSYSSAGAAAVEHMKRLAQAGDGLNSYIMKNVKSGFESKW